MISFEDSEVPRQWKDHGFCTSTPYRRDGLLVTRSETVQEWVTATGTASIFRVSTLQKCLGSMKIEGCPNHQHSSSNIGIHPLQPGPGPRLAPLFSWGKERSATTVTAPRRSPRAAWACPR